MSAGDVETVGEVGRALRNMNLPGLKRFPIRALGARRCVNTGVEHLERNAARLRQHEGCKLRWADVFCHKPSAFAVDDKRTQRR